MNQMKVNDKYAIRYHRLKTGWEWQYLAETGRWHKLYSILATNNEAKWIASRLYGCNPSEVKIIKRKMENNP